MKKLPPINALYWLMIISANTIGESGGDLISQSLDLGYGASTVALIALFAAAVIVALCTKIQHPAIYWTVIILSSTAGTTMSDYITRTLGLGYGWGTLLIVATLAVIFIIWRVVKPKHSIKDALSPSTEFLYWSAILTSSTLGTAFGDFISNGTPLGFGGGTMVLVAVLIVVTGLALFTKLSREFLYWAGITITHPLGATMGDYLTKEEGLGLGNVKASIILSGVFIGIVLTSWIFKRVARKRSLPLQV